MGNARAFRLVVLAAAAAACAPPDISGLNPSTGPVRTLVEVSGDNFLAETRWDAGTPSEVALPGSFLAASVFSVPAAAALGPHNVQLLRDGSRGNTMPFTVTATQPFGAPRLDHVSLGMASFDASGNVTTWLLVQGANVDVGAEVLVNGVVQPTVAYKGIRNDLLGVAPASLGYPIYHHLALLSAPGPLPVGSTLSVSVRNTDNQTSNVLSYTLPLNQQTLDSDGDDIPDDWEMNGYDADNNGTIDVDLPALGADPHRPDVLLEVDVMQGLTNPPTAATFNAMRDAYAAAPFINLGPNNGINLILDTSGSVPFWQSIDLTGPDNPAAGFANFYTLKAANFDNAHRGRLYYYCIWANARPGGSSGVSDPSVNATGTDFSGPGDDCIVSFDDFPASYQGARSGAETLMHEIGHDFQQRHGGSTHFQYVPNYSSVMSYDWQLRSGQPGWWRAGKPVCFAFYYGQAGATETNGVPSVGAGTIIDYSDGMGANLVESSLNEAAGVCNNIGYNWDGDANPGEPSVSVDLDNNGVTTSTFTDYPNWARLVFGGPRLNGGYGP